MMLARRRSACCRTRRARSISWPAQRRAARGVRGPVHRGVSPQAVTVVAVRGPDSDASGTVATSSTPGPAAARPAASGTAVALYTVAAGAAGLVIERLDDGPDPPPGDRPIRRHPARLVASADETADVSMRAARRRVRWPPSRSARRSTCSRRDQPRPTRMQFGRAIGSFQAVKHGAPTCSSTSSWPADGLHAAWSLDEGTDEDARIGASLARRVLGRSRVAAATIRCMAGSVSPGSTRLTSTTSARSPMPPCSAARPTTASAWPSSSWTDGRDEVMNRKETMTMPSDDSEGVPGCRTRRRVLAGTDRTALGGVAGDCRRGLAWVHFPEGLGGRCPRRTTVGRGHDPRPGRPSSPFALNPMATAWRGRRSWPMPRQR